MRLADVGRVAAKLNTSTGLYTEFEKPVTFEQVKNDDFIVKNTVQDNINGACGSQTTENINNSISNNYKSPANTKNIIIFSVVCVVLLLVLKE